MIITQLRKLVLPPLTRVNGVKGSKFTMATFLSVAARVYVYIHIVYVYIQYMHVHCMHIGTPVGATDNQLDLCWFFYTKPALVLHNVNIITFFGVILSPFVSDWIFTLL